ncbi:hypothetical protein SEVIR_5G426000v4 [Setaria viridis]|uniref:Uncharacterized protein n=1 Tax=Setaria viridis TaxID=4556 RepID=A0A4U6UT49_SETVI|nr:hypothetical protein SEVIR_5G426000v2 [Setaria viridis]
MKMPSARAHQKRCRDTAGDDIDVGGARGAPRRATFAVEDARPAEQLEPAEALKDDGSRQEHTPLEPCSVNRDAATQVSEAQLLQEFGSVKRMCRHKFLKMICATTAHGENTLRWIKTRNPSIPLYLLCRNCFLMRRPAFMKMSCRRCRSMVPLTSPNMQLFPSSSRLTPHRWTRSSSAFSTFSVSNGTDPRISPPTSVCASVQLWHKGPAAMLLCRL